MMPINGKKEVVPLQFSLSPYNLPFLQSPSSTDQKTIYRHRDLSPGPFALYLSLLSFQPTRHAYENVKNVIILIIEYHMCMIFFTICVKIISQLNR